MPATTALPVIRQHPAAWQTCHLEGISGQLQGHQPQAAALQLLLGMSGSKAAWQVGIWFTGPLVKMDMYQCTITLADSVIGLQLMAATHSLSYPHHSHSLLQPQANFQPDQMAQLDLTDQRHWSVLKRLLQHRHRLGVLLTRFLLLLIKLIILLGQAREVRKQLTFLLHLDSHLGKMRKLLLMCWPPPQPKCSHLSSICASIIMSRWRTGMSTCKVMPQGIKQSNHSRTCQRLMSKLAAQDLSSLSYQIPWLSLKQQRPWHLLSMKQILLEMVAPLRPW